MGNRSPLLNVIFQSLNNVTRNMLRDFGEIENLQVSPNSLEEFVSKTEKKISNHQLNTVDCASRTGSLVDGLTDLLVKA